MPWAAFWMFPLGWNEVTSSSIGTRGNIESDIRALSTERQNGSASTSWPEGLRYEYQTSMISKKQTITNGANSLSQKECKVCHVQFWRKPCSIRQGF